MLYNAASSGAPPGTASGTPSSSNVIAPNTPELTCVHQLLAVHQDDLLGLAMMNIRYALQNVELLTGDALTNNNPFHCLEQVLTALQSNPSSSKTCNNNALFELALRPRLQTAFIRSSDQEDNNIINNAHIRRHFVRYVYFQSLVYLQQQGGTDLTLNEEVTSTNVTTSYYDDVSNVASTYYHYPYSSEYDTTTTAPLPMFSITGDLLEDNDDDDDAEEEGGTSPKGPDVVDGEMHYLYIVRINSPPPTPSIMNTDTINSNITALNSILGSHYSGGGTNNRVVGLEEGVMPALLRPIRVPSSSSSIPSSVSTLTSVVSNSNLEHGHHIFASPASESGLLSHGAFQYYETFEGVPWIGSDISAFPVHLRKVKTHEKGTMGTTTIPVWCYEVFSCQVVKNILREGLVSSAVQLIAMGASVDIFDSNVVTTIAPTDTHHNNNKPSSASLPTVGESFETLQRLATELELVLKKKPSQVTIHKSLLTTISELFKLLTDVDEEIMEQAQKREELQSKFLKLDEECKNSLRLLDERVISVRDHEEGNRARDAEMRPLEDNLKALSKELARPSSDDRADVRDLCKNIRDYFVLNPTSVLQFLNNAYHRSSKAKADISTTSASSSSSELTTPTMTTLKKGHGAIQAGARNLVLTSSNSWAFRIFDPLQSGRLDCIAIRSAIAATCNASAALHDRHHHQTQYHPTTPTTTNMSSILRVLEDLGRVPDIRRNRGSDIPYVVTNK